MPHPIVVAHHPDRDDGAPVDFALAVAGASGARVIAVTVLDAVQAAGRHGDRELRREIDASLGRLRAGLGVETRVLVGTSVARAIQRLAEDEAAELIVAGTTARGPFGRLVPGSTAERLLHGARRAVAIVPPDWTARPIASIATAFADTPEGHAALRAAHRIAVGTGAQLRAISVMDPAREEEADVRAAAVQALRALGPEGDVEIYGDDVGEVLLRAGVHADLLVCGSRGHGPLTGVVLGSVSRRLVDGARCPVLVVPRGVEHPLEGLLPARAVGQA